MNLYQAAFKASHHCQGGISKSFSYFCSAPIYI
jgi:hypothetical protein